MIRAILDTNVLLDFIKIRDFHREAGEILDFALEGRFQACVSAHQVTTLASYLEKSARTPQEFRKRLSAMLGFIEVLPVNRSRIDDALKSTITDFEDAVLEAVAFNHEIAVIVTRNTRDFPRSRIEALSPSLFLNRLRDSGFGGTFVREPTPDYRARPRRRKPTRSAKDTKTFDH